MAELGWAAVRVRDLTGGGYKEQVRGLDLAMPNFWGVGCWRRLPLIKRSRNNENMCL